MARTVVLIRPPSRAGTTFSKIGATQPPMNLFYLREFLKVNGIKCFVIDFHYGEKEALQYLKKSLQENPGCAVGIGFSALDMKSASEVARIARKISPNSLIIAGGAYPTALPEGVLSTCREFDLCAIGEGERTFLELAAISRRDFSSLGKIDGIVFRKNKGGFVRTRKRALEKNLDNFPFVDRSDPEFSDRYSLSISPLRADKTAYVMFSRGCPYSCAFCQSGGKSAVLGKKWRVRSVRSAILEMSSIASLGYSYVQISDDIFGLNRKWLLDFCREMEKSGLGKRLKWSSATRADLVNRVALRAMKGAGCVKLGIGLESGSPKILREMGKGETAAEIKRGFLLAKKAGIPTYAFVVVGFPGETWEDFEMTEKLVLETDPDNLLAMSFVPIPGTAGHEKAVSMGLYSGEGTGQDGYFLDCGAARTGDPSQGALSQEDVGKARDRLYFKFYSRPRKIIGELLKTRSVSQLLLGAESFGALLKVGRFLRK